MMRILVWPRLLAAGLLAVGLHAAAVEPPREVAKWLTPQVWRRDAKGPIVSLGREGEFDDQHIFAPAVVQEAGQYRLWYCGSRGTPGNRVFRLGLASGDDGRIFA